MKIRAELTIRNIGSLVTKEDIDTTEDSPAAKYFRRMMRANGAYQADSTSERIEVGHERANSEGMPRGRPPGLHPPPGEGMPAYICGESVVPPGCAITESCLGTGQEGTGGSFSNGFYGTIDQPSWTAELAIFQPLCCQKSRCLGLPATRIRAGAQGQIRQQTTFANQEHNQFRPPGVPTAGCADGSRNHVFLT